MAKKPKVKVKPDFMVGNHTSYMLDPIAELEELSKDKLKATMKQMKISDEVFDDLVGLSAQTTTSNVPQEPQGGNTSAHCLTYSQFKKLFGVMKSYTWENSAPVQFEGVEVSVTWNALAFVNRIANPQWQAFMEKLGYSIEPKTLKAYHANLPIVDPELKMLKHLVHGVNYGMGADALMQVQNLESAAKLYAQAPSQWKFHHLPTNPPFQSTEALPVEPKPPMPEIAATIFEHPALLGEWLASVPEPKPPKSKTWYDDGPTIAPSIPMVGYSLQTQKAISFNAITSISDSLSEKPRFNIAGPIPRGRLSVQTELFSQVHWPVVLPRDKIPEAFNYSVWFGRPCPLTPRHGFVESREVRGVTSVYNLFLEARAQDPKAELILAPKLRGKWSGVLNNAGVTWGLGNAGVTNAEAGTIFIPASSRTCFARDLTMMWRSVDPSEFGIPANSGAFVELVEDFGVSRAVQVRAGPMIPSAKDYMPFDHFTVREVIIMAEWLEDRRDEIENGDVAEGDVEPALLLEWETAIAEWAKEPGAVIFSQGAPLASHWAVHAIANKIPFITTARPEIGTSLIKTESSSDPLTQSDVEVIAQEMSNWFSTWLVPYPHGPSESINHALLRSELLTACACVHTQVLWDNSAHLLRLRAMFPIVLARILACACFGELRHCYGKIPEYMERKNGLPSKHPIDWKLVGPKGAYYLREGVEHNRENIYIRAACMPWDDLIDVLPQVVDCFNDRNWGTSYGGKNWANSTTIICDFIVEIMKFQTAPTPKGWTALSTMANAVLNTMHNGGKLVHKLIGEHELNSLTNVPGLGLANSFAASVALYGNNWLEEILQ